MTIVATPTPAPAPAPAPAPERGVGAGRGHLLLGAVQTQYGITVTPYQSAAGNTVLSSADFTTLLGNRKKEEADADSGE